SKITLVGLQRTKPKVVLREITFSEGDWIPADAIKESVQNLKNLELFSEVRPYLELQADKSVHIRFELAEKWTTIPYLSYAEGGGTVHIRGGAYDINVFGKYIELGAEYESLNGTGSGFLWYRNPRLFNQRLNLLVVAGTHARPRKIYKEGVEQYRFGQEQEEGYFILKKEFSRDFTLGLSYRISSDMFSDLKPDKEEAGRFSEQLNYNERYEAQSYTFIAAYGKLDFDSFLVKGREYRLDIVSSRSDTGNLNYTQFISENKFFYPLRWHSNLASRLIVSTIDTNSLFRNNYVGGLTHVRGYYDGQFLGSSYWLANLEYRVPSMNNSWVVLQHIFFVDVAQVRDRFRELDLSGEQTYSSVGLGIRFIIPKIYRFNGRLDIAFPNSKTGASGISIGAQQFF
ncbi:MAG: BamA/TamA family outer membrane protein, partial [Gammaproteobacteria bacterium]|nr:BamA/TamA family outer membrane protein [Gammaproteobacteria bacterium]